MKRGIMLSVLATMLAGCGTEYAREIRAAEPLSNHRFTRVEFEQAGHRNSVLFQTYDWCPVSGFVLVADDGWRLVVHGAGTTGYNWSPDAKRRSNPVYFRPGVAERMTLIDPDGRTHPVRVTVGDPSPRPPHVTIIEQPVTTTQPEGRGPSQPGHDSR